MFEKKNMITVTGPKMTGRFVVFSPLISAFRLNDDIMIVLFLTSRFSKNTKIDQRKFRDHSYDFCSDPTPLWVVSSL